MNKIVECVPNFSEGNDKKIIDQIVNCIGSVANVEILDVDMGADTNRTVVTFIGELENISEKNKIIYQLENPPQLPWIWTFVRKILGKEGRSNISKK